jgi:hypothetical protein
MLDYPENLSEKNQEKTRTGRVFVWIIFRSFERQGEDTEDSRAFCSAAGKLKPGNALTCMIACATKKRQRLT